MLSVSIVTSTDLPRRILGEPRFDVACVLQRRPPRERSQREAYDRETVALLRDAGADVVLLLGYLYIVTTPLLRAFPGRILNVHDGTAAYPGLHATRDAIVAGERETFSIVHVVTEELDRGPVVAMSAPFSVAPFVHDAFAAGHFDIVRAYAYAQREWMMRSAWPELIERALARVAMEAVA